MSIEKALKDHTIALNRFCDFCEKYGVIPATDTVTGVLANSESDNTQAQATKSPVKNDNTQAQGDKSQAVSESAPVANDEVETPIEESVWTGNQGLDEAEPEEEMISDVVEAAQNPVSVAEVADSMKKLLPTGRNTIVAILDKFGVAKVTELKAEDLAEAKRLFDEALGG